MTSPKNVNAFDVNMAYRLAKNAGALKNKLKRGKAERKPFVQVRNLVNATSPSTKKGITFWAGELGFRLSKNTNMFGSGKEVLAMADGTGVRGSYKVFDRKTGTPMRFTISSVRPMEMLMGNKTNRTKRIVVASQDGKLGIMGTVTVDARTSSPRRMSPIKPKKSLDPSLALQLLRGKKLRLNISKKNGPSVVPRTWRSTALLAKERLQRRKLTGMSNPSSGTSLSFAQRFGMKPNRVGSLRLVRFGSRQGRKK